MKRLPGIFVFAKAIVFALLIFLFAFLPCAHAQTLIVPPAPGDLVAGGIAHLTQSNDYIFQVKKSSDADYTTCFVYKTDNYASNVFGSERRKQQSASFANFSFGATTVEVKITVITPGVNAGSVMIRPLNCNIKPVRNGNVIMFTLASPKKISVEINNRLNPLFIFADAPDNVPAQNSVTYFYGPGIHNIGLHKQLNTGDKVYIAGGAVVQGTFYLPSGQHDIEVRGRGIITNGNLPTTEARRGVAETLGNKAPSIDSISKYAVFTASKVKYAYAGTITYNFSIEGLILTNTSGTHFAMVNITHGNHHNTFRNIKEVDWSGNTDNVFDGDNNVVDDCFFFNNDDGTVTRGSNNLKITNITYWGGNWGRFFWTHDYATSSGVTFNNINAIGHDGERFLINITSGRGTTGEMKDFTFSNMRVEEHPYVSSYAKNMFINMQTTRLKAANWLFENITVDDQNTDEGAFNGNSVGTIDVTFRNLKMAGNVINTATAAHFIVNTANVTFQVVLPSQLRSLKGTVLVNKAVSLQWITASEVHSEEFIVQKSVDGIHFETAGTIAAVNAIQTNRYSFEDSNPFTGACYYRLKMMDKNGSFTFSNTLHLMFSTVAGALKISPNPVRNTVLLTHAVAGSKASASIMSENGSIITRKKIPGNALQTSVDVAHLPAGQYLLLFENDGLKNVLTFLK